MTIMFNKIQTVNDMIISYQQNSDNEQSDNTVKQGYGAEMG